MSDKTINFYPAKLSDDDLQRLRKLAGIVEPQCPAFADWLTGFVNRESARRVNADHGGAVSEVALPTINPRKYGPRSRWELAKFLRGVAPKATPAARDLMTKLADVLAEGV